MVSELLVSCHQLFKYFINHKNKNIGLFYNTSCLMDWCYVDDTTLMAESKEEEPKSLLMRVKEESEKASLKLNIKELSDLAASLHGK